MQVFLLDWESEHPLASDCQVLEKRMIVSRPLADNNTLGLSLAGHLTKVDQFSVDASPRPT